MRNTDCQQGQNFAIFTVASNNYIHFARTLLESASNHHPNAHLFLILVDKDDTLAVEYENDFTVISLHDLNIPNLQQMIFQYDVLELNTAVKPWAFETLLNKGYQTVIYFDPDIFVYSPITKVIESLAISADIVVTPHLISPIYDHKKPSELDIRRAGTYNFGFCAVANTSNTLNFLHWWQSKLARDCIVDIDRGIFVDQSWIDLVPGLFDRVLILRNPSYNVAYWNIGQRVVSKADRGCWTVDNEPLTFFHFSGFNVFNPHQFSKHQNRFNLATLGPPAELVVAYRRALLKNGAEKFSKLEFGYSNFLDGTPIPSGLKRVYLNSETLRTRMGNDPFESSEYAAKLAADEGLASALPLTWSMHGLYMLRPDLKAAFDLMDFESASNYWNWFISDQNAAVPESVRHQHLKLRNQTQFSKTVPSRGSKISKTVPSRGSKIRRIRSQMRRYASKLRALWRAAGPARLVGMASSEIRSHPAKRPMATGLYLDENDHTGIWCSRHVSIPLGHSKQSSIHIVGQYDSALLYRNTNKTSLTLNLKLDGQRWKSVTIPEGGQIAISEIVPKSFPDVRSLQIETDAFFTPFHLGLSEDKRELSWRLIALKYGDLDIFDASSENRLLPLSQLYRPKGFNLIGYISAELGLGEAARSMALAANAVNIPYSLHDVSYQTSNRQLDMRAKDNAVDTTFDIDLLYVNADATSITLSHLERTEWPHSKYRIGFWHWEQPRFPEEHWDKFDKLNEVWVPSSFVQDAISSISPIPVFKVPHAINFNFERRLDRRFFGIPKDKFTVLVMYDFHSYRIRKNPEAAIAAFKRATVGRNDAALVIKTINAEMYADDYSVLKAKVADLTSVVLIDQYLSREEIYLLEANCDCMLSLHRAEGFGLGLAEMMFLGKPVIATGWSGNMEFMTSINSFPIQYELKPLPERVGVYHAGTDWAEPDIEHAAHCLLSLLNDHDLAEKIGKHARYTMLTKFSPEVIGRHYMERLSLINAWL